MKGNESETHGLQRSEIVNFVVAIFNDVLVSSTLTLTVNIYTWKKKKPYARRGNENFRARPGEHGFFFFQV